MKFLTWFEYCDTPQPKGRRNREHKVNLNDRNHIMPTRHSLYLAASLAPRMEQAASQIQDSRDLPLPLLLLMPLAMWIFLPSHQGYRCRNIMKISLLDCRSCKRGVVARSSLIHIYRKIRSVLKQAWTGAGIVIQPIPGKNKRKMNKVKGFAFLFTKSA